MPRDAEEEAIRRQFLEEAQDYLDKIETVLLNFANQGSEGQVDAALRAAHSIKGGAAMMGFQDLSHLAHDYEDFFKIIKAQRKAFQGDTHLETLLLGGLDRLREIVNLHRQERPVDSAWLETHARPIFNQLHQHLDGVKVQETNLVESPEGDGEDIAAILFESEVEASLQRLETVLATPGQPCLREEFVITAQELGGLGEMLQITPFINLCQSIVQHLESAQEAQVQAIADAAMQAWRRSQTLILVGQSDLLPHQLVLEPLDETPVEVAVPIAVNRDRETTADAVLGESWATVVDAEAPFTHEEWTLAVDIQPTPTMAERWPLEGAAVEIPSTDDEDLTLVAEAEEEQPLFSTAIVSASVVSSSGGSGGLSDEAEPALTREALDETDLDLVFGLAQFSHSTDDFLDDFVEQASSPAVAPSESGSPPSELFDETAATALLADFFDIPSEVTARAEETIAAPIEYGAVTPQPSSLGTIEAVANPASPSVLTPPEAKTTRIEPRTEPVTPVYSTDTQENTVRVPVRQLEQLTDLFGELTIERNGLLLNLGRLRNLVRLLNFRARALEQSNARLRSVSDSITAQVSRGEAISSGSAHLSDSTRVADLRGAGLLSASISLLTTDSAFDSLEMDQYNDLHLLSQEIMEAIVQIQEVTSDIELGLEDADQTVRELNRTSKQMQTSLTQVRMRPLSDVVGRFPRAIRELSRQHGKGVELKIYGAGTLIDRTILEALNDPLMHLLRNCFDHGIEEASVRRAAGKPEQGLIEIRAAYRGNRTIITMSDNGGGINLAKIRAKAEQMGLDANLLANASDRELLDLIFEPGFSTADQVTTLSGRGVGMDVVRTNLQQIRGEVRVDTEAGIGTTFTISVPFNLSVVRVLLVEATGMMLAFPKDVIEEVLLLAKTQVVETAGADFVNWEGYMLPLIDLHRWLSFTCPFRPVESEDLPLINQPIVLMVGQGTDLTAIRVDRCWGEQEVAIRQVEGSIPLPVGFAGCSILGDGRIVPLVDAAALLEWMENVGQPESRPTSLRLPATSATVPEFSPVSEPSKETLTLAPSVIGPRITPKPRADVVMIIDDSVNVRRFLALTLEKAGYHVEQAKDGQDALDKLMGGLRVEAIVCDIEMPRLDGFGFLARVKADNRFAKIPVAMLTSRIGDKHRRLGMSLGAAAYFSKPFKEQELLQTLKQLIHPLPALS